MINFILCDDNKYVTDLNETIIKKVTMPYDFSYKIHSFDKYNLKLKNLINAPLDVKIYILDLELPDKTGLDIAREIRRVDWDSIIIILTSHDELELNMSKQKLLIFDFISKFDNYEKRLSETLKLIINKINMKKIISFKCKKEIHYVNLDNILYIYKDNLSDKTTIVTTSDEYPINESLVNIINKLDSRFYQTHRACYINVNKIDSIDYKNGIINFTNGKSIDYLSKNYKKGLREVL